MRQFSVMFVVVAILACYYGAEASSLLACSYGESAVVQGQSFIDSREEGHCLRQVACTNDLQIKITECKDIPCAQDSQYNQFVFPDCCCGVIVN